MENDTNEKILLLQKKVKLYFDLNTFVHLSYKNGKWMRGTITELSSDFFMLNENLNGMMPVFYLELKDIEPYQKEEKDNQNMKGGYTR